MKYFLGLLLVKKSKSVTPAQYQELLSRFNYTGAESLDHENFFGEKWLVKVKQGDKSDILSDDSEMSLMRQVFILVPVQSSLAPSWLLPLQRSVLRAPAWKPSSARF